MRRTHLRGHTNILKRSADSCGWLQSRARHASSDRRRHAARPAGPPGRHHRHVFRARGSDPTSSRRDRIVASMYRDLARPGLTDHARCQLVSGGDLYHGLLRAADWGELRTRHAPNLGGRLPPHPCARPRPPVAVDRRHDCYPRRLPALSRRPFPRTRCPTTLGIVIR